MKPIPDRTTAFIAAAFVLGLSLPTFWFNFGLPAAIDKAIVMQADRVMQQQRAAAAAAPAPRIDTFTFAVPTDQKGSIQFALQELIKSAVKIADKVKAPGDFKLNNADIALMGNAINFLPKRDADGVTEFLQRQVNEQIKEAKDKMDKDAADAKKN